MLPAAQDARQWLRDFEAAVRAVDFEAGRRFFADDAVAFGTYATAVSGRERIVEAQWRHVWPRIRDFRFESEPVIQTDGDHAWVAAAWSSQATAPDGQSFMRPGRATFILARRDGRWVAVHSHVSLEPSQSETAHGRRPAPA
ncbi:MAG: nuclear transport factor 2 family protein [Candidatus Rokubacteria bacterium]|nr:nuclear transport factor 2 family protein [Candidatus Rokubacteria bacterium]